MSLFSTLRTGVSGMNAQSNRISTVAENIQNASTTGYKRTSAEFSSLLLDAGNVGNYNSGAVETTLRRAVSEGGPIASTNSDKDLAIQGNGFFVVSDAGGAPFMTRAGNFVVDGKTGNLVNAGGFTLMGYSLANGTPNPALTSTDGLVPVNIASFGLQATPSTKATVSGNLSLETPILDTAPTPTTVATITGHLPGNAPILPVGTALPSGAAYSTKLPMEAHNDKGQPVILDAYLTRTEDKSWSIAVYESGKLGDFPGSPIATKQIDFKQFDQWEYHSEIFEVPGGQAARLDIVLNPWAPKSPPLPPDLDYVLTAFDNGRPASDVATYSKKSSIVMFDNVGQEIKIDIYLNKVGADMWVASTYSAEDIASYPDSPLSHNVLRFGSEGKLISGGSASVALPNGQQVTIDLSGFSQLAADTALTGTANGKAPSAVTGTEFGSDGVVYATYADGTRLGAFQIPLADVKSPHNLNPRAGNVFQVTMNSGDMQIGFAGQGGRGIMKAGALEQSNVDVSTELTTMIESQTVYTANSKVFMTGNELLETLMNLKR